MVFFNRQKVAKPLAQPLIVVVSKEHVLQGDTSEILAVLKRLIESPETARQYMENVDVMFSGYDNTSDELWEIPEVRNYVHALDGKFSFWLFFLSKHMLGLRAITYCFLLPFLTDEARKREHPRQLDELLTKRWFPAMNQISEWAGLSEKEIEELSNRSVAYLVGS